MTKALVILSEGAEEMETVISVDVLRRGGVNVIFVSNDLLYGLSPFMHKIPYLLYLTHLAFEVVSVYLATFGVLPMVKSANLPMVLLVPFLPMVTRKP